MANTVFLSFQPYPDEVTYKLIATTSREVGLSSAEILRRLGKFWVHFVKNEGYVNLMTTLGPGPYDMLAKLNEIHVRVGLMMADLQPPTFDCEMLPDGSCTLWYSSKRPGLAPMVLGLVEGVGALFESSTIVSEVSVSSRPGWHEFRVRFEKH